MLQLLYGKKKYRLTLRLIRKWLRAPILINGSLARRRKGLPQGSPLSPIMSDIMLHELDRELERQGRKYVRFADAFSIYTKSKHEALTAGNSIYFFLKNTMKLRINREKSGIRKPSQFEILGYKFTPTSGKETKGRYQLGLSPKSWKTLKDRLKTITRKTTPQNLQQHISDTT